MRVSFWFDARRLRVLLSFSGWQMFGSLGWLLRSQGSAVLLNKCFSPLHFPYINASYSIGNQVSAQSQALSSSMVAAFTPEITAAEGRGERKRMLVLAMRASKYGVYLISLFAVPLMLETNYVLTLWLKEPPQLATGFCRLALAMLVVDKMTSGQMTAVAARGRIAGYQMMLGGLQILTLPVAWLALRHGAGPLSVMWVSLATMSGCSMGRVIGARLLVGSAIRTWVRQVLVKCIVVLGGSCVVGLALMRLFNAPSLPRLLGVCTGTLLTSLLLGRWLVFDRNEWQSFIALAHRGLTRMRLVYG